VIDAIGVVRIERRLRQRFDDVVLARQRFHFRTTPRAAARPHATFIEPSGSAAPALDYGC
jgi:hypothetical protein